MSLKPIKNYDSPLLLAISKLFQPFYARTTPYSRELNQIEIGFKGTGFELKAAQIMCGFCHLKGKDCTGLDEKAVKISTLEELGFAALAIVTTHPFPPGEAEHVVVFDETTGSLVKKRTHRGLTTILGDSEYYGASSCKITPPEAK